MLTGHRAAADAFLAGWASERLHHAWLLAGPQGVGKRSFADAAALTVLAGVETLGVPADHPTARLVAAGSHMDHRVLERLERDRGGLAASIVVDQVRKLNESVHGTPVLGDWRAVIVDAAEDMNPAAANALLKNLEEPPARTLFLLVSHAPGRLLPTIRSRCRRLRFDPLSDADTRTVLGAALPEATPGEVEDLVTLAAGAPGRAIAFAGLAIGDLVRDLDNLAADAAPEADARALRLSRALSARAAQPRYEAFLELAPRRLAAAARVQSGAALARTLRLWESARTLAAEAGPAALDPAAVVFELSRLVAGCQREPA